MDYERRQQYQAFDIENPRTRKSASSMSSVSLGSDRMDFVRKVYGILTTQLLFTTLFSGLAFTSGSFQEFQVRNLGLFYVCMFLGLAIEIAIFCCQDFAKRVPQNYIALAIFTFCQSYVVSTICSTVYLSFDKNGGELVLAAAILTLGICTSLTIYAFTSKSDFTMLGGTLFMCGMILLLLGLFAAIFSSPFLHFIYLALGTLLYGFYIIYDTQLIAGGRRHQLDSDDYIVGALIIYMDIVMLFLQILQILVDMFGSRSE